jgi:hypothetical protein
MIPKKTPQQIFLQNLVFIKVHQNYIKAIEHSKIEDFIDIKTTLNSLIEDVDKNYNIM